MVVMEERCGVGTVVVGKDAALAFRRPRSDLTKLLSTTSSSNFFRLINLVELRRGCCTRFLEIIQNV